MHDEEKLNNIVSNYLKPVNRDLSETAKSHLFLILLNNLFGIQPGFIEEYISGFEKYVKVKRKDFIIKGRIDNLFGNLVIEFERDLIKKQKEAEEQLKKYIACLWSQEEIGKRTSYLCIATDGTNFRVYSPNIYGLNKKDIQPKEIQLILTEKIELPILKPLEIYLWLDRYFLRRQRIPPKTENIVKDFGIKSHAFQVGKASLLSMWHDHKIKPNFSFLYENWEKYLRIVYGTSVGEDELFCKHTYLVTLAKLMVWQRLAKEREISDENQIISVLEGVFFKKQGIENFLEEDFFSWIVRDEVREKGIKVARMLLSLLSNYKLIELSEDVFKSLYQELVDPETRHDLGEFYTPDWLAHRIIKRIIKDNPSGSFLDPACGSGTFLYLLIHEKKNYLKDKITLEHILNSIFGIDIHPLAVIIAKTNYILALGELLKRRKGKISIPIYLADSIKLPEKINPKAVKIPAWFNKDVYEFKIDDKEIYFSEVLIQDPVIYDKAIEAAKVFATQNIGNEIDISSFTRFIQIQYKDLPRDNDTIQSLFRISKTLKDFIEQERDTILGFVLKNIYKPLFLKGRFDFVIGNPPWLVYGNAEREYQNFLKSQIIENYKLVSSVAKNISNLELGTLFLLRTADLYLKNNSTIAFVLPRSIFNADQHDGLRQKKFRNINFNFKELWDLEQVEPLFNIPACVLIAKKEQIIEDIYPVYGEIISGKLDIRNASLEDANEILSVDEVEFYLNKAGIYSFWSTEKIEVEEKESFYKNHFFKGANIFPRAFWFVEVKTSPLGIDPHLPLLETSKQIFTRKPYKDVKIRGVVESDFLYFTLLSYGLLPFGYTNLDLVILPILQMEKSYKLLTTKDAKDLGYYNLAKWIDNVQKEWEKRRGKKAESYSAVEWLNYINKLTSQNPSENYLVLYNTSGTHICSCFIEKKDFERTYNGQKLKINGFCCDHKTYYFETQDKNEAYYLMSVLNSSIMDEKIRPLLKAIRDIHKRPFAFPIPKFNPTDKKHLELTKLAKTCSQNVFKWVEKRDPDNIGGIGKTRAIVRKLLKKELNEIDRLVIKLL